MASRLNDIALEIKSMLEAITNFGSVNETDVQKVTYPCVDVTYTDEKPDSETQAAYGYENATFRMLLKCKMTSTTRIPPHSIDAAYDEVIQAIKLKFRECYGYLPLSGNAYIHYEGFVKNNVTVGNVYIPINIEAKFTVRYQQTETV